jgi:hypothetical protein
MQQSLDLDKENLKEREMCLSPERKSMGNKKNMWDSPFITKKRLEIFDLTDDIGTNIKKSSFEMEFENHSVISTKYFSKFENDYEVLGVIKKKNKKVFMNIEYERFIFKIK